MERRTINDRAPNFRHEGDLFLVRCYACDKGHGTENWASAVPTGRCVWCGWTEEKPNEVEQVKGDKMSISERIETLRTDRIRTGRSIEAHKHGIEQDKLRIGGIEKQLREAFEELKEEIMGDGIDIDIPTKKRRSPNREGSAPSSKLEKGWWSYAVAKFFFDTKRVSFTALEFYDFLGVRGNKRLQNRAGAALCSGSVTKYLHKTEESTYVIREGITMTELEVAIKDAERSGMTLETILEGEQSNGRDTSGAETNNGGTSDSAPEEARGVQG